MTVVLLKLRTHFLLLNSLESMLVQLFYILLRKFRPFFSRRQFSFELTLHSRITVLLYQSSNLILLFLLLNYLICNLRKLLLSHFFYFRIFSLSFISISMERNTLIFERMSSHREVSLFCFKMLEL